MYSQLRHPFGLPERVLFYVPNEFILAKLVWLWQKSNKEWIPGSELQTIHTYGIRFCCLFGG